MSGADGMETVIGLHRRDVEERVNRDDASLRDYGAVCSCGQWNAFDWGGSHDTHLAQALRDAGFGDVAAAKAGALNAAHDEIKALEPPSYFDAPEYREGLVDGYDVAAATCLALADQAEANR